MALGFDNLLIFDLLIEETMDAAELKQKSKAFALRIIKFIDTLPKTRAAEVIGRQLLRSATSVGANYRAACRARSQSEFISRISLVEEEADESLYWLELIKASKLSESETMEYLEQEARVLTAIFSASRKTAKRRLREIY